MADDVKSPSKRSRVLTIFGCVHGSQLEFKQEDTCLKDEPIKTMSSGSDHMVVVGKSGRMYTMSLGANQYGQCGFQDDGAAAMKMEPRLVSLPDDVKVLDVACGEQYTLFSTVDGRAFSFGRNDFGQLGLNHTNSVHVPTQVSALHGVSYIAAGSTHSAAIADGRLYTWGDASYGKLSYLDTHKRPSTVNAFNVGACQLEPRAVINWPRDFGEDMRVKAVSLGMHFTAALSVDGFVLLFGRCYRGILSQGNSSLPTSSLSSISSSSSSSSSLPEISELKIGDGLLSQDDVGEMEMVVRPRLVSGTLSEAPVRRISAGRNHMLAVTKSGSLYCWGDGFSGQLGVGQLRIQHEPYEIKKLRRNKIKAISSGHIHSAAITSEGELYTWGSDLNGTLGHKSSVLIPVVVKLLQNHKVIKVSCSKKLTVVLSEPLPESSEPAPRAEDVQPDLTQFSDMDNNSSESRYRRRQELKSFFENRLVIVSVMVAVFAILMLVLPYLQ